MPPRGGSTFAGGENPQFILRDFEGMNLLDSRDVIGENEFQWLENVIPVGKGKLVPVGVATTLLNGVPGEVGSPSFTENFNQNGVDYIFAVWKGSGNGWIVNMSTYVATKIISTVLTSGKTAATQWSNLGLLIIDPAGYWDYNITTANTLTSLVNSASSTTLKNASSIPGGTTLRQSLTATGSGATFQTQYQVTSVSVKTAGTGYAIGDVLLLTDGNPSSAAQVTVTGISGGGSTGPITSVLLSSGGTYPGPTSITGVAVGPAGSTFGGGTSGSGAVLNVQITATSCTITGAGTGYSSADTVVDQWDKSSTWTALDTFAIVPSGVIGGTTIAVYAGRVWSGSGRTISFTNINSYNSYGGAGGSFTIPEAYLHTVVTALCATNNYLYIFGDSSVDALSNVSISATTGVTSFTRVNLTTETGTSQPNSVFPFLRGVAFAHASGFYVLSGSTPEKVSEKISGIVQNIVANTTIYGMPIVVEEELCAAFLITFVDQFYQVGVTRSALVLFFRNRWWVASFAGLMPQAACSIPIGGVQTAFLFAGTQLIEAFSGTESAWVARTRLWDGGAPLREKQGIIAVFGCEFDGETSSNISLYVDTETESQLQGGGPLPFPGLTWINDAGATLSWTNNASQTLTWEASPQGYFLLTTDVTQGTGAGQYLGMTVTGQGNVSNIRIFGLQGKTDRNMLQ